MMAARVSRAVAPAAAALSLLLLLASPSPVTTAATIGAQRNVTLRTEDGVTLAASWYEPSMRPAPAVILVHMLNRSRHDWDALAARLSSAGIGALAIDLRGHGDSQGMAPPAAPPEYAAMAADVTAARRFLASRPEVVHSRLGVAGASLGATLAVLASGDASIASLALLSPALDYRGVRIEATARKFGRPMLLVASNDDGYASRSVKDLQKGPGTREVVILNQAGHGTAMLSRNPDLAGTLVDWFRRTL